MEVNFSVVIPLYNKEANVAKTISSVLNQTYQNFDVIIVNDYSTDNSLGVVKAIHDHRIKIIEHSENKGVSSSRNTGINAATNPYIAFLDADDQWDPVYLETIWNLVKNIQTNLFLQPITEKIILANQLYPDQSFQKNKKRNHLSFPTFSKLM